MADECRPSATNAEPAESNSAGGLKLVSDSISAEDRHAAFCAGLEQGRSERVVLAIEDRARALLATWATESRDMATEYASRVGPNWAAMVTGEPE